MKKSTAATLAVFLILIPLTLFLGLRLPGRGYYLIGTLIVAELLIPFFLAFEGRRPQARELVVLAVLSALAVAARVVIPVPHFKAIFAVIMLSGIAFGPEAGFLVGAVSALASNFFYGQGPYTPWQMMAYGAGGMLAGFAFGRRRLPRKPLVMGVFGFFGVLLENGWTQEQVDAIESTAYTGWSRSEGKKLFTEWLDSRTVEEIAEYKWIFTHDDEIGMGILEALKSSEIDTAKKEAFLAAGVHLASSSGLNEMYSVIKGIHQKDYAAEVAGLADLFTVTYDPAMIQIACDDMITYLDGGEVTKDHVIPVDVVDATNVNDFRGFGDAVAAE